MSRGQVSARRDASNLIISTGPDVCLTPVGGDMVPVAYTSVANLSTAIRTSTSVRNNGNVDFQLNSRCAISTGHEAGVGKGIKIQGYKGYAFVEKGSDHIASEGYSTVSHRDSAWINRPDEGGEEGRRSMGQKKIQLASLEFPTSPFPAAPPSQGTTPQSGAGQGRYASKHDRTRRYSRFWSLKYRPHTYARQCSGNANGHSFPKVWKTL